MIHNRTVAIPLVVALTQIAGALGLDAAALISYAYDDPHGGYHAWYEDGFPIGSMWRVEGQALYALIRALRPVKVLELGTWHGCSATHALQALHDNGYGVMECVDASVYGGIVIGDMIPEHLRYRVEIHQTTFEDALEIALKQGYRYDFIIEDGMHEAPQVAFVWETAKSLLSPGGVIVSHDAMHETAGPAVQEGLAAAGFDDYTSILISPADCGLAVWRKGTA
jgi:predicted O-methyltransferase YrrM